MSRTRDRLSALEALLLAPEAIAGPRPYFLIRLDMLAITDWPAAVAHARAEAVGNGLELAPDARPAPLPFASHDECEEWLFAQQAHLIAQADAGFERIEAREAERKESDNRKRGESNNMPVRNPKPKTPPTFTPATFAPFART